MLYFIVQEIKKESALFSILDILKMSRIAYYNKVAIPKMTHTS